MKKEQREFAIRNFRAMVGTEYSGQEKNDAFIELAILWYNKKSEIFPKLKECHCGENDLNLRDFVLTSKDVTFVYKCDYCPSQQSFRYKRQN